jgi:hypothetical protein
MRRVRCQRVRYILSPRATAHGSASDPIDFGNRFSRLGHAHETALDLERARTAVSAAFVAASNAELVATSCSATLENAGCVATLRTALPPRESRALTGLHGPALFTCGGMDTVVPCEGIANTFRSVTDQPAMFMNNLAADHGSWLGQNGSQGPTFFALTAWFRVHLMDDVDNRQFFFGPDCALCTDDRVAIERNGLMNQLASRLNPSWNDPRGGATRPGAGDCPAVSAVAARSMPPDPPRPLGVAVPGGAGAEPAAVVRQRSRRCRSPAGEQRHPAGAFAVDAGGREALRSAALRGSAQRAPPGAGTRPQPQGVPLHAPARRALACCDARGGHDARRSSRPRHPPRWARARRSMGLGGSAQDSARR